MTAATTAGTAAIETTKPPLDNKRRWLCRRSSTLESVTEYALRDLHQQSVFFSQNTPRELPQLDKQELVLGDLLGQGQFGAVYELVGLRTQFNDNENDDNDETTIFEEEEEEAMRENLFWAFEENESCSSTLPPHYAVKMIPSSHSSHTNRTQAILDLAGEAEFLSRLAPHPNIVTLHATVGEYGSSLFMLVLDGLAGTLAEQIQAWKREPTSTWTLPWTKRHARQPQLRAALDVAHALQYLHRHHLLFRDLKPENVGWKLTSRNSNHSKDIFEEPVFMLLDFGLCKELKPCDLVEPPCGYQTTGVAGSRRYMAPEVALNLPYGYPADVYSFGILMYQILSLETPFGEMTASQHFKQVIVGGQRPRYGRVTSSSKAVTRLLEQCGSPHPDQRPSWNTICTSLETELERGIEKSRLPKRMR